MTTLTLQTIASKGYAFGLCSIMQDQTATVDKTAITQNDIQEERQKIHTAIASVKAELLELGKQSAIFQAHVEIADDPALLSSIEEHISSHLQNAQHALHDATTLLCHAFSNVDDAYLKERVADIKDVSHRIMQKLQGVVYNPFAHFDHDVILFAEDFTPSDTALMDFKHVKGFVTEKGGVTSHVSIIARQLKIPAIVGATGIRQNVTPNQPMILDAVEGILYLEPDQHTTQTLRASVAQQQRHWDYLNTLKHEPTQTKDGTTVELFANVGSADDIVQALGQGAEGVGLFRTELLFMNSDHFPTEEEQFIQYKDAVSHTSAPVIVRTLDIGGDKSLPYFQFDTEENPFLGYRAIRLCLDRPEEILKPQLRALLRASHYGDLRIMYPMIISVEEYKQANHLLTSCKNELKQANIPFNPLIQTGIMIETPAAVLLSSDLAAEVDFFSIGTNDLTQYLLCVDRGNLKISHLFHTFHPAVLRAIAQVIENAHHAGKMVGLCGEFASDPNAIPLLLGMGLDEFSVVSSALLEVKHVIRETSLSQSKALVAQVLTQSTLTDVLSLIEDYHKNKTPSN